MFRYWPGWNDERSIRRTRGDHRIVEQAALSCASCHLGSGRQGASHLEIYELVVEEYLGAQHADDFGFLNSAEKERLIDK